MKKTAKNLLIAFSSASQTRTRYELYSEVARKENYLLISRTFKELANQEWQTANNFYKQFQQIKSEELFEDMNIEIEIPTLFGTTQQNLEISIKQEDEEWQDIFPKFAAIAKIEGYLEISKNFKQVALSRRNFSQRLKMLLNLIMTNTYFNKDTISFWKCLACGYEIGIENLPNDFSCPSCGHLKSYFQRKVLQLIQDEKLLVKKQISGWICMECGYEVPLEELPSDWKCVSCGRSKAYFKRKSLKPKEYVLDSTKKEKATWVCLECGNEEEIDMPDGWKCPKCGFPKDN